MSSLQTHPNFTNFKVFAGCDESEINHFLDACQIHQLKAEEPLFTQGDEANSLYLLATGIATVSHQNLESGKHIVIDKHQAGAILGEMALITNSKRTASVHISEDAVLYELTKDTFLNYESQHPCIFQNVTNLFEKRLQREQIASTLHVLFPNMDDELVHDLQERLIWKQLKGGDVLFEQDDEGSSVYFVINGRLQVALNRQDNTQQQLSEIQHGDMIGEFTLFIEGTRSATVSAIRDSLLVELTKDHFESISQAHPTVLSEMTKLTIKRVQSTNKVLENKSEDPQKNIVLVPLHESLDVHSITSLLTDALAAHGQVKAIDKTIFAHEFPIPNGADLPERSPFNPLILAWFGEQERDNQFTVLTTDLDWSLWTQRCLRQADRIVFLADAQASPNVTNLEKHLLTSNIFARCELMLIHPDTAVKPENTADWLTPRSLHTHYHLKANEKAHYDRVARRMANKAIGVVFSGGGARGFAHLGIAKAMEELNIPIDYIGGTSMGSILAAGPGMGDSYEDTITLAGSLSNPKTLFDYTLPITSIMSSTKLTSFCKKVFGGYQIEDLWVPFFCIATNATTAELEIINSGPLWKAIRKSISIPGVFTPVMENGDVIIDGGVMNNFPVDVMEELAESNRIIGVNVSPYKDKKRTYSFDTGISGWSIFWSRINPFAKKLRSPSLVGTILRALELNSVNLSKRQLLEKGLLIEVDIKSVGILDFKDYRKAVDIGFEASFEKLKAWWSTEQN